ncbi:MAG: DUF308 domain-containing protein [Rikenellaceae bacterium]|jgi:uncharacterized membrane protein HdeD (DUF308 family)|nr:DUF308 domain-containing protein [Rikenellaceae bacterium]
MEKRIVDNGKLWKGIFAIGIGLIMVAWPGLTTRTIVVFLGIALLVLGAILLIGWIRRKRAGAPVQVPLASTVTLLIGLCMTAMPQLFINILLVVFGILLVLAGLDQILTLILGRQAGVRLSVYFYIAPVLVLAIGLYLMFSPQTSAQTFILLFGITAIVYGVVALYDAYLLRNPKIDDDEEESI